MVRSGVPRKLRSVQMRKSNEQRFPCAKAKVDFQTIYRAHKDPLVAMAVQ